MYNGHPAIPTIINPMFLKALIKNNRGMHESRGKGANPASKARLRRGLWAAH